MTKQELHFLGQTILRYVEDEDSQVHKMLAAMYQNLEGKKLTYDDQHCVFDGLCDMLEAGYEATKQVDEPTTSKDDSGVAK